MNICTSYWPASFSTTASINFWICLSNPPMSEYCSVGRKCLQDEVRVLVYAHQIVRLEFLWINQAKHGQNVRLPCQSLDYGALALPLGVQHHHRSVVLRLLRVHVQQLDRLVLLCYHHLDCWCLTESKHALNSTQNNGQSGFTTTKLLAHEIAG
ncbi:uncharacterized protein LOC119770260 [Culex quinquefasciatus]|uniref:uncharacterized protein LOC119770260 n=1 Tax=Culex quinquefasciatus TaxID=7176 RepID=UPI0018E32C63|nr:uncharacterized protein LOC119770260 [Culex quinquefasciatus]